MFTSSGVGGSNAVVEAFTQQNQQLKEQLNKSNAILSNEKVAQTTGEKKSNKRTVSSLRIPIKASESSIIGVNTADTTTGLNIPV